MLYEGRGNHFVCDLCKADLKETPKYALYFEAMSRCEFCPVHSLRSMKRNDKEAGKWAHITCITYMPGAYINKDGKTYHNGVNPKCYSRQCAFCRTKEGGVVYCKHRGCYTAFHVLCGRMHDCVLGWDEEKVLVLLSFDGRTTRMCSAPHTANRPTRTHSARFAVAATTRTTCYCATGVIRATTSTA